MYRHLHARLGACAFKDDVEAVWLAKLLQGRLNALSRAPELLVGRFGFVEGRGGEGLGSEPVGFCEIEPGGVDVDGDDEGGAAGFCEGAGEESDGADAEDEDGLSLGEICAF